MGISLLDSVYLDVRDSLLVEAKLTGIESGQYKGGSGPSLKVLQKRRNEKDVLHGGRLGLDLINSGVVIKSNTSMERTNNDIEEMLKTRLKQVNKNMHIREEIKDGTLVRRYKTCSGPKGTKSFMVRIGNYSSCTYGDFEKQGKKVKCKHVLFVLIHCLAVSVDSELLRKLYVGDEELRSMFDNAPSSVPNEFVFIPTNKKKNYKDILSKETAPNQIWSLVKKDKRSAKCRHCKSEIHVGNFGLQAKGGLVVPFEEEKAVERTQYFCPKKNCISTFPPWTNLRRPSLVKSDTNVSEEEVKNFEKELEVPIERTIS